MKIGDLVMVVKTPRCGCELHSGKIFTVTGFWNGRTHCSNCKQKHEVSLTAEGLEDHAIPLWRLHRIDPLAETQETENYEVMTK